MRRGIYIRPDIPPIWYFNYKRYNPKDAFTSPTMSCQTVHGIVFGYPFFIAGDVQQSPIESTKTI